MKALHELPIVMFNPFKKLGRFKFEAQHTLMIDRTPLKVFHFKSIIRSEIKFVFIYCNSLFLNHSHRFTWTKVIAENHSSLIPTCKDPENSHCY